MQSILILHTVIMTLVASTVKGDGWHYPKEGEPTQWGGICDSGKLQSPINIIPSEAIPYDFLPLNLANYRAPQKGVKIVNNGHTVQLFNFPTSMAIGGGPLEDYYILEQIHFHWWSEHTIKNVRYPLEVHLVHRNTFYPSMKKAMSEKEGLAVISALFYVSNIPNKAVQVVIDHLEEIKNSSMVDQAVEMKKPLVVHDFFPVINGYYSYYGSLTTPTCDESVNWIVLKKKFPISEAQAKKFTELEDDSGSKLMHNYRPVNNYTGTERVVLMLATERSGAIAVTASILSALLLTTLSKLLLA